VFEQDQFCALCRSFFQVWSILDGRSTHDDVHQLAYKRVLTAFRPLYRSVQRGKGPLCEVAASNKDSSLPSIKPAQGLGGPAIASFVGIHVGTPCIRGCEQVQEIVYDELSV
jgi:hypothetical protein